MAQPERLAQPAQTVQAKTKRRDTVWLIAVSSILLLALLSFSSYIVSLPFIRAEWEMSNTQAGLVFSIYLIGYAASSLLLIPLTDTISPRRVLITGVIVMVGSHLLFPLLAWNYWIGALLRFIAGAGHVAVYIPGIQLVSARFVGSRRGTAVAVFVGAGYAGTTLSYTFMGALLSYTESWRTGYFVTSLTGLVGIALAFMLVRNEPVGPPSSEAAAKPRGLLDLSVLRDRSVTLVILAYALHTAELYLARLWLPLLIGATLIRSGRSEPDATALAGTLAGFMFVTGIAGVFVGGALSDRLGRCASAALIFSLSGVCSLVVGWLLGAPPVLLIVLGFVYGFVTAADSAIYSTAITELSPPGKVGSTQAVQSFIGFAIGSIVPVIAGAILDVARSGAGWGLAFSFNGALAVVGVVALLWLRRLPQAARLAAGRR